MDMEIALILGQDGITNGAIYALLALALVLVFAVTRVIFIQQGEFVAYGALTLAMMQGGTVPATVWLLLVMGVLVTALDDSAALRAGQVRRAAAVAGWNLVYPLALLAVLAGLPVNELPLAVQVLLTLGVVVPLGPMMYRLMYQPIASAPVLILLKTLNIDSDLFLRWSLPLLLASSALIGVWSSRRHARGSVEPAADQG